MKIRGGKRIISSHWLRANYLIYLFLNLHNLTLKMKASCSSETSVTAHKSAQFHYPEDHNLTITAVSTSKLTMYICLFSSVIGINPAQGNLPHFII
jgi:hypothetical protein